MCDRCAHLAAENKELREALEGAVWLEDSLVRRIQGTIGGTRQQAELMAILYRAPPEVWVSSFDIDALLPGSAYRRQDPEFRSVSSIRAQVYAARRNLGPGVIESANKLGYRLSAKTRERIRGFANV